MFFRLFVCALMLGTSAAWAQRVLSSPDLSTFSTGGLPSFSVDANTGFLYMSGFANRAMGLARTGVVRVTGEGVMDASFQTTGISFVISHVAAPNGDLYVRGFENTSGGRVITRYSPNKSALPVSVYRADGVANDPNSGVGAIYGGRGRWVYFTNSQTTVGATLRRIDTTTGLVDPSWSYSTSQRLVSVEQGSNDALFLLEEQYPGIDRNSYVRRISTGLSADLLWTRTYAPGESSIAADAQGRVYFTLRAGFPLTAAAIQRIDSAGNVDTQWAGGAASQAFSQSRTNRTITAAGDALLVPAYVDPTPSEAGRTVLLRFDSNGVETARYAPGFDSVIQSVTDGQNGRVYVKINNALQVLDASTLQPMKTLALTFGSLGYIYSAIALPNGGRLLLGRFDVIYGGQRFQNVLRTKADGTPDTNWRVDLDDLVQSATVTPQAVLLTGRFTRVNGVPQAGVTLVSLAPGALLLPWRAAPLLTNEVFAFDGQDYIYFTTQTNVKIVIQRVSLTTALIDPSWGITVEVSNRPVAALGLDKAGGVWLFRDAESLFPEPEPQVSSTVQRFNVGDGKPTLTTTLTLSRANPPAQRLLSTAEHVYLGSQRFVLSTGGQLDANWNAARIDAVASLKTIAGGYLYYTGYNFGTGGVSVRRASLAGNGAEDATWSALPNDMIGCRNAQIPLFVAPLSNASDAAEFVIRCTDSVPSVITNRLAGDMALATTANKPTVDTAVIEYLNRDANRYFITGRPAEQAMLDALPASFQRTGMRFSARSGEYRDVPEIPVCRFYAAPESGGSNTHFYGTGDDCPALNTVQRVRFEGFDFAAIKPINTACIAAAPSPVYRLFNNKSATNEGNHRYVVSTATKSKMIAQGWVDEGAVFCSTSVVDAAN